LSIFIFNLTLYFFLISTENWNAVIKRIFFSHVFTSSKYQNI